MGGAIGDALGFPVGAYTYEDIVSEFGPGGIQRYKLNEEGLAVISDDTQMSLFTVNGILLKSTADILNKEEEYSYEYYIEKAYLEWLLTQQKSWNDVQQQDFSCWLSQVKELFVSRDSRTTCLSALCNLAAHREVENESCGSGGLMRIAPIGLMAALHPDQMSGEETVRLGAEVARITHKHPLGFLPAGCFAYLLQRMLSFEQPEPQQLKEALEESFHLLSAVYPEEKTSVVRLREKIEQAIALADSGKPHYKVMQELGEGWVAEENLAIAVYCTLCHWGDFQGAVVAAVNHSGDSASTGAVTGNLMGVLTGYTELPEYELEHLELREVIREITRDLIDGVPEWHKGMTVEVSAWLQKYREAMWPVQLVHLG